MNEKFQEDAKNLFMSKCNEIHKENKIDVLSKMTVDNIINTINTIDKMHNDSFYSDTFTNFLYETQNKPEEFDYQYKYKESNSERKQIEDFENFMENQSDEVIEYEGLLMELGPYILNNNIKMNNNDIIDFKIDEERLARFFIFLCNNQTWQETKENRYINKVFIKFLNKNENISFDDNEDTNIVSWNLQNFYKLIEKKLDNLDVRKN